MPFSISLSLADRFRGALLGAALGEVLGANYQQRLNLKIPSPWLEVDQWGFEGLSDENRLAWGKLAIKQVQSAIQLGQFSSLLNEQVTELTPTEWMGLTVAALPIALFYHDDWQQLKEAVQENLVSSHCPSHISTAVLMVGYTLCLTLQEQLHPPQLIPQLIAALDLHNTLPALAQHLDQVQIWHQNKVGLSVARSLLTQPTPDASVSLSVPIALHSFLQTPHNFQVSLLQTARLNYQPQVACALVGALSGACNGIAALPLAWRRRLQLSALSSLWQVSSEAELLQYADLLLASWSGVHVPHSSIQSSQSLVTASPGIIRPR